VIHVGPRRTAARLALTVDQEFKEITMPNSTSSKKRLRQNQAQRLKNRSIKSSLRTSIRKVRTAVDAGDAEASTAAFQMATKKLDQAAAKSVIHANKAARTKSRLSKAIKAIKTAKA
jgi:small subunit ribosomal protein S20